MLTNSWLILPPVLQKILDSEHKFCLTGSRAWRVNSEKADYDFFAQYSEGLCDWLKEQGFSVTTVLYRVDTELVKLYERKDTSGEYQVQLVRDFKLKEAAQMALLEAFPMGFTSKDKAAEMWAATYKTCRIVLREYDK
jgi:hypothetical protein